MNEFVAKLKEDGVFAKEVRSAGVAFHSYYMASIAPALLSALKKVTLAKYGSLGLRLDTCMWVWVTLNLRGFLSLGGEGSLLKSV